MEYEAIEQLEEEDTTRLRAFMPLLKLMFTVLAAEAISLSVFDFKKLIVAPLDQPDARSYYTDDVGSGSDGPDLTCVSSGCV